MYAIIETDTADGHVRVVWLCHTMEEAFDLVVDVARTDGYLNPPEITADTLRAGLRQEMCYTDGGVLTTVRAVSAPGESGQEN